MLKLFILNTCNYCKKVMKFLDENGISYEKFDISDKENEDSLIYSGGKKQVPFLIDTNNNVKMYESDEIIKYLQTQKG